MAFNGSGVFVRLYNWVNDAAANIKIRADRMDDEFNGIATGLSSCITKDGQTTVTANLPMSGYKHTNVANAASTTEYASASQVINSSLIALTSVSGTVTITASAPIILTAYTAGQMFSFVAAGTATGPSTLNIDGLGAKAITKKGTTALTNNDILIGCVVLVRYDGTQFQLLNPMTSSDFTGTLAIANGGTGQTSANAAFNALAPAQSNNTILGSNGTNTSFAALTYAQVASGAIATASEIRSATASKLVDAAQLLTALQPYSSTDATTSGADSEFTSIPAGVRRIVVNFAGCSSDGTGLWNIELGDAGGYETAGYVGAVGRDGASTSFSTAFVLMQSTVAADVYDGTIILHRGDTSTNTWHIHGLLAATTGPLVHFSAGTKSLSAELDRLRVVAGGNNFDAGKITVEAFYF